MTPSRSSSPTLLLAALCVLLPGLHTFAQSLVTLAQTGPRPERVNIVMLSEGYTSSELGSGKFTTDATQIANTLLNTEPFKSYRPYFNVYGISVASAQSGADEGSAGTFVNTYFNATFNSYGIDRLLTVDSTGTNRVYALLNQFVPEYDIVLIVVNDSKYGGSGGTFAVTSTNTSAPEIAIHEIGHSFADLGDEYDYAGSAARESPNTTQETSRNAIRWNAWINGVTPLPTPETGSYGNGLVGLFEGAAYHSTGWYRPTLDSKMNTLGMPFYAVNEEAIVLSIYRRISALTGTVPGNYNLTVDQPGQSLSFTASGPSKAATATPVQIQWYLDGVLIPGQSARTLALSSSTIGNGTHTVQVRIQDTTTKVRTDPTGLLRDDRTWTLNLSNQGPAAPGSLVASASSSASVTLTWTDLSTDEDAFVIQRASATGAFAEIGRTAADATSYTDSSGTAVAGMRYRVSGAIAAYPNALGQPSNVVALVAPGVTKPPASASLVYGQTASLAVTATGTPGLNYQWRYNKQTIPGASAALFEIPDVDGYDAGAYDCVVSNAFGSALSKPATLTIAGVPFARNISGPASAARGSKFTLGIVPGGTPAPTLQWLRNGVAIAGATKTSLTIAAAKDSDAGEYECLLANGYGSTTVPVTDLAVTGDFSSSSNHRLFGRRAGLAKWQWVQRVGGTLRDGVSALAFADGRLLAGGISASTNAKFGALPGNALGAWSGRFHPLTGVAEWVKQSAPSYASAYGADALTSDGDGHILAGASAANSADVVRQSFASGVSDRTTSTGSAASRIMGIACAPDGSVYAAEVNDTLRHLVKIAADGSVAWQRATNGYLTGVFVDGAGRIFISGAGSPSGTSFENASPTPPTVVSDPGGENGGFVVCYDADGNVQWTRLHGYRVMSIAAGADAGHLCAAADTGSEHSPAANLLVLNSGDGSVAQTIPAGAAAPEGAVTTPGGEMALLMRTDGTGMQAGGFDMETAGYLVAKYSTAGSLLWLLPVQGQIPSFPHYQGRLSVNPADGRLYVGFTFSDDLAVQFADRPVMPTTGRQEDGFLACISEGPAVVTPPQPQMVALNGPLHLSVEAGGFNSIAAFQWYKDGKALKNQTLRTFDLASAKLTDAGSYHVRITGSGGYIDSPKAAVNVVDTTARYLSAPLNKVLDLPAGVGGPGLSFTWWRGATRLFNTGGFLNTTTSKLRISTITPAFVDSYVCKVTGLGGTLEAPFTTGVMQPPVFETPTVPDAVVSGEFFLQLRASEAATYVVKNLPAGLTYNSRTGIISGRPNLPGPRLITVTASNAAGASASPALTFTINVSDFAPQAKGGFQALVERQPWNADLGGMLNLNVSATGSVTGSVTFAGQKFVLNGRVDASAASHGWTYHLRLARSGKAALLVDLVSPPALDGVLTGTVAQESSTPQSATVSGYQTVWSSIRPANAFAGTFNATLTLPGMVAPSVPPGDGSQKTVITASTGAVSWSGRLSDDTSYTGSSKLWPNGTVPQWIALYSNLGSLTGAPALSSGQQTGSLEWTRNPKGGAPAWSPVPLTVTGQQEP